MFSRLARSVSASAISAVSRVVILRTLRLLIPLLVALEKMLSGESSPPPDSPAPPRSEKWRK